MHAIVQIRNVATVRNRVIILVNVLYYPRIPPESLPPNRFPLVYILFYFHIGWLVIEIVSEMALILGTS
jgi:hypothetical protein